MKDHLVIEENLTPDDINGIYYIIDQFGNWVDGSVSYSGTDDIKKNLQIQFVDQYAYQKLSDIVYNRMDTHRRFHHFTVAKNSNRPLITRTPTGGYYKPHHDVASCGDFSTTIYLNDEFEGGELCLWLNDEEIKIKPKKGKSVTYKTDTPHRVSEVTEGHRDAVVFWTYSFIKDPFDMMMYRGLTEVSDRLTIGTYDTLAEAQDDPAFIIDTLQQALLRKVI